MEDDPEVRSQLNKWLFTDEELLRTPSIQTGHDAAREAIERGKGCDFVQRVCHKLHLPPPTLATASIFLHRFYMRHSLREYHYYEVAATCVFLATKCEETVKKLRDIVIACCQVASKSDRVVDEQSKDYWRWRDVILYLEETLLEALCFDLNILQPYTTLKRLWKQFGANQATAKPAWMLANESVRTAICIQHDPRTVAAASLLIASQIVGETLVHIDSVPQDRSEQAPNVTGTRRRRDFHEICDVNLRDLAHCAARFAELYETRGPSWETTKLGIDVAAIVKACRTVEASA